MVRIRLKRMGRRHRPFYRVAAIEKRNQRDGKVIERLGWYDPLEKDESKSLFLKEDRIKHWLGEGAQPSDTMKDILAKRGLIDAEAWKAERMSRVAKKMKLMEEAKAKAEAEAKAAAEAEAAAKAKAEAEAKAKAEAEAAAAESTEESGDSE